MSDTESVSVAKDIQRSTGPTFHLATRFLPERVRHPTYILYAFFRKADQVVDDPDPRPPEEQHALLDEYQDAVLGAIPTDDPVLSAMADLVDEHDLSEADIQAFIASMRQDIDPEPFDSHDELGEYLHGSAVAVGFLMLQVMDPTATSALPHARALGEAFQLTNFIRDVREDIIEYDRIYLPRETLEEHGVTIDDIRDLRFDANVASAIEAELRRTEDLYRTGVAGIDALPADCQFPVLLAAVFYAEYHRLIEERGYNVIDTQPSLSKQRYLSLGTRTWLAWKRSGDPEAVFYRVSAIDPRDQPATLDRPSPFSWVQASITRISGVKKLVRIPLRSE